MIRNNVVALGMLVDILTWDGNVDELRVFTPDQFHGVDEHGTAHIGSALPGGHRVLREGDYLIRPAGCDHISPLHLFHDSWWARELLGIEGDHE